MTLDPVNILQLIFASQASFFAILMAGRPRFRAFTLLLAAFALHMVANFLAETGVAGPLPDITSAFGFAYGPLIYYFVRTITLAEPRFEWHDRLHGLPFLVAMPFSPAGPIFNLLILFSITAYLTAGYRHIKAHNAAIKANLPEGHLARLDWVVGAFWALVALTVADGLRILAAPAAFQAAAYPATLSGVFLVFCWLIFNVWRYREQFEGWTPQDLTELAPAPESALTDDEIRSADRALAQLAQDGIYLLPRLKLSDFADNVGIEPRDLSRLLYRHTGKRFPQIVNRLRVEEAQRRIRDAGDGPLNLLRLSYDTGFNSKSSFNLVFKQITGQTPSAYRKSVQNPDSGRTD